MTLTDTLIIFETIGDRPIQVGDNLYTSYGEAYADPLYQSEKHEVSHLYYYIDMLVSSEYSRGWNDGFDEGFDEGEKTKNKVK